MPFLLAEILDFQGSAHLIGVGSLSKVNELVLPTMLESIDDQSKVLAVISTDTEITRKGLFGDELMMEIPEIHILARKILKQ